MLQRFRSSYGSVDREEKTIGSKFMKAFETNKRNFDVGVPLVDMPLRMSNVDESLSEYYHSRDGQVMLTE
jgi:hypothetical protein